MEDPSGGESFLTFQNRWKLVILWAMYFAFFSQLRGSLLLSKMGFMFYFSLSCWEYFGVFLCLLDRSKRNCNINQFK